MDRPVFVLGCPRSGTTLLRLMLNGHPRIAIPPENRYVIHAYNHRDRFGDLRDRARRAELAEFIVNRPESRVDEFEVDRDVLVATMVDGPPELAEMLAAPLRAYARAQGKERWGDKRPAYFAYLDELHSLFPGAQFVSIVRDGRDVVSSLRAQRWFNRNTATAISMWAQAVDYVAAAKRRFPAGTIHELRYEDLVDRPEQSLRTLCGFLNETYDPAMAEPHEVAGDSGPGARRSWHRQTAKEVSASRVGVWAERLTPAEITLCETVLASRLRSRGYELTSEDRADSTAVLQYRRIDLTRRLAIRRRRWGDRLRSPLLNPLGAWLRTGERIYVG